MAREQRIRNLWKLEWGFELIDLEHEYYLARFYSREDYYCVLKGGPWISMVHYLMVYQMKIKFSSLFTQNPIYYGLGTISRIFELYDEEVLYAIGNTVGCTVHIDGTTLAATREKYARICIEVDLAQLLLPFIIILGCLHNIEYEGLFMICFDCGKYSYKVADCPGKQKETAEVDSTQPMNLEKDTENNSDKWSYGP